MEMVLLASLRSERLLLEQLTITDNMVAAGLQDWEQAIPSGISPASARTESDG